MNVMKFPRYNEELMKNLPKDMLLELITLEDVIPDTISSFLDRNNPTYKKERGLFLDYNMDIVHKMYAERGRWKRVNKEDPEESYIYADIEFIERYPQFKSLINHIEFKQVDDEGTRTILKEVPIDEYLAEN